MFRADSEEIFIDKNEFITRLLIWDCSTITISHSGKIKYFLNLTTSEKLSKNFFDWKEHKLNLFLNKTGNQ